MFPPWNYLSIICRHDGLLPRNTYVYFLKEKDNPLLRISSTSNKIRLTLIKYYHLILKAHSHFSNCLNKGPFSRKYFFPSIPGFNPELCVAFDIVSLQSSVWNIFSPSVTLMSWMSVDQIFSECLPLLVYLMFPHWRLRLWDFNRNSDAAFFTAYHTRLVKVLSTRFLCYKVTNFPCVGRYLKLHDIFLAFKFSSFRH